MEPTDKNSVLVYKQMVMSLPPGHYRMRAARLKPRAGRCALGLVLAVLVVAVLWPVYTVCQCSPQSVCLGNERRIGMGVLMYAQDYDETLPCGTRNNRLGNQIVRDTPRQAMYHAGQGWAGQVWPYVMDTRVFVCPTVEKAMQRESQSYSRMVGVGSNRVTLSAVSYSYNRNLALNTALAKAVLPAQTVMLAEVDGSFANVQDENERSPENAYSPAGNGLSILASTDGSNASEAAGHARYAIGLPGGCGQTPDGFLWRSIAPRHDAARHSGGACYMLLDGHAKFLQPEQVSPGDNALAYQQEQDCAHHRASDATHLGRFAVTFSTR